MKNSLIHLVLCGLISVSHVIGSSNHLVIINAPDSESYNLAISAFQYLDFDRDSKLTVYSTHNHKFLLNRQPFGEKDGDWKSELAKTSYFYTPSEPFDLTRCYNIYSGHFSNDDRDHSVSEIVTIFTGNSCICGDTSFIDKIRKKKTFVVAIGIQKTDLCPIFKSLAANDGHIFDVKDGSSLSLFIEIYRIRYFEDKKHICDTDRFKQDSFKYCSNKCFKTCATTALEYSGACKQECPYYKRVNISALHNIKRDCALFLPVADMSNIPLRKPGGLVLQPWEYVLICCTVGLLVILTVYALRWAIKRFYSIKESKQNGHKCQETQAVPETAIDMSIEEQGDGRNAGEKYEADDRQLVGIGVETEGERIDDGEYHSNDINENNDDTAYDDDEEEEGENDDDGGGGNGGEEALPLMSDDRRPVATLSETFLATIPKIIYQQENVFGGTMNRVHDRLVRNNSMQSD